VFRARLVRPPLEPHPFRGSGKDAAGGFGLLQTAAASKYRKSSFALWLTCKGRRTAHENKPQREVWAKFAYLARIRFRQSLHANASFRQAAVLLSSAARFPSMRAPGEFSRGSRAAPLVASRRRQRSAAAAPKRVESKKLEKRLFSKSGEAQCRGGKVTPRSAATRAWRAVPPAPRAAWDPKGAQKQQNGQLEQ
jgi:hypothetical protein